MAAVVVDLVPLQPHRCIKNNNKEPPRNKIMSKIFLLMR
jgi:hypothetical protein